MIQTNGMFDGSLDFVVHARAKSLQSCPTLFNPMDCKPQAPLSMGFARQEYWSGLPFPSPRDLPDAEVEHVSLNVSCIGRQEFD